MKWRDIVRIVVPVVLSLIPAGRQYTALIPVIVNGIDEAEAIKGASGADKKQHVLNLVANAVDAINGAAGKTVLGATAAQVVAGNLIDAAVSVVNLVAELGKPSAA